MTIYSEVVTIFIMTDDRQTAESCELKKNRIVRILKKTQPDTNNIRNTFGCSGSVFLSHYYYTK